MQALKTYNIDLQVINRHLIQLVGNATSQYALGVYYMLYAMVSLDLHHKGELSGLDLLAKQSGINIYYFLGICVFMSSFCFLLDRLPIHYAIASIPVVAYSLYLSSAVASGLLVQTGILAALSNFIIAYLFVLSVVRQYQLKQVRAAVLSLKADITEQRALIDEQRRDT